MARDGLQYRALSLGIVTAVAITVTLLLFGNASGVGIGFIRHHPGHGTPTPTSTSTITPPPPGATNDEFTGPLGGWVDVKVSCGATGNGVTNDTAAIQTCLTNLSNNGGVLYFPAGTYLITGTLTWANSTPREMIGHSPIDTIIKWGGSAGGTMMTGVNTTGFQQSKLVRITFDGNNSAGIIIAQPAVSPGGGSGMEWADDVFKNATTGVQTTTNGALNSEETFLRDTFTNLGTGLAPTGSFNSVDWWVFYCTFTNNGIGLDQGSGNYSAWYNVFQHSTTADMRGNSFQAILAFGNLSSGSARFYSDGGSGANPGRHTFQNNRILNTTAPDAIHSNYWGDLAAVDNQILSAPGNTSAAIVAGSGNASNGLFSLGNQFTVALPAESNGSGSARTIQIDDQQVSAASISTTLPSYPFAPNVARTVHEITAGTSEQNIQNVI